MTLPTSTPPVRDVGEGSHEGIRGSPPPSSFNPPPASFAPPSAFFSRPFSFGAGTAFDNGGGSYSGGGGPCRRTTKRKRQGCRTRRPSPTRTASSSLPGGALPPLPFFGEGLRLGGGGWGGGGLPPTFPPLPPLPPHLPSPAKAPHPHTPTTLPPPSVPIDWACRASMGLTAPSTGGRPPTPSSCGARPTGARGFGRGACASTPTPRSCARPCRSKRHGRGEHRPRTPTLP